MVGLPGRPELLEQRRQVAVHLAEGDVVALPARPAAEGVQHQKRLVRGALAAATPDVEAVELAENRLVAHASCPVLAALCYVSTTEVFSPAHCPSEVLPTREAAYQVKMTLQHLLYLRRSAQSAAGSLGRHPPAEGGLGLPVA